MSGWRPAAELFDDATGTDLDTYDYDPDDRRPGATWRQVQGEWDSPVERVVVGEMDVFGTAEDLPVIERDGVRVPGGYRSVRRRGVKSPALRSSDRRDVAAILDRMA